MNYLPIPPIDNALAARFFAKIGNKTGDCYVWAAHRDKDGYGSFKINRKTYRATRVAYRVFFGVDPAPFEVCHSCDNPSCVTPTHLFLGTTKDNQRDKWSKGRQSEAFNLPENKARGSRVNTSKLSEAQALDAIARLKKGERQSDIAADYGVNRHSIYAIAHGKNWKHLPR